MYYFRFVESCTTQYIKQQLTSLAVSCSMLYDIVPELQICVDELLNLISVSQIKRYLIKSVSVFKCVIYICCQLLWLCGISDRWMNLYRTLVEWYRQEKMKYLEKPAMVPLCLPHIPHRLARDGPRPLQQVAQPVDQCPTICKQYHYSTKLTSHCVHFE